MNRQGKPWMEIQNTILESLFINISKSFIATDYLRSHAVERQQADHRQTLYSTLYSGLDKRIWHLRIYSCA